MRDRYTELMYRYDIIIERFVTDTSEQNDAAERSGEVIIRKVRCLRITVNLLISL